MNGEPVAKAPGVASALSVMAAIAKVGVFAGDTNLYAINFLYNQWRPSWRRQTCPRTSRPVIVRLGMMTVRKCQAVVVARRWLTPRVKLMAVIVASGFNRPASCTGRKERPGSPRRLLRWQPRR